MLVGCRELYVCQGFLVVSMMDRQHFIEAFLLSCGTRWWNIMKLSCEQQGCNSQYNVRLMNNIRLRIFCYQMNTFIKTFLLLTERDVITSTITDGTFFVIRPPSSSCATWSTNTHHLFIRPAEDFYIKTAAKTLYCDWQHFESTPRNSITLWTITVNHL